VNIPQWPFSNFPATMFYVKSILADFRRSKAVISTILEALNFDFFEISYSIKSKVSKNSKLRAVQMVKMAVLWATK